MKPNVTVLILYQFKEHEKLLQNLKLNLKKFNIDISLFNTRTFKFSEKSNKFQFLQLLVKIPKIRVIVYRLFRDKILLTLSKNYKIVDIHYFSTIYDHVLKQFNNTNIKISFWGSDAYRITEERKQKLNNLTSVAKLIRFNTIEMYTKMESHFEQKEKLGHQIFGNSIFETISDINFSKIEAKRKLNIPIDKISVFVGYNACKGQQHNMMLNQINNLPKHLKNQLVLILPLTYGADNETKEKIITAARDTKIETIYFKNSLTEVEIGLLRLSSDIVINFQITDAFSGSLQEHFYTNSIMIVGDWLLYDWLKSKGLFFYTITENKLTELMTHIIENFEEEKQKFITNKETIYSISSWGSIIESWGKDYYQMIKST